MTEPISNLPASTHATTATPSAVSSSFDISQYAFPDQIDPAKPYLFYVHGKIVEEQGIPAVSPDFGEYQYAAILERLSGYGYVVISEQRARDTDAMAYGRRLAGQVKALLEAGVPAENITLVGASKGGAIAIFASHFLANEDLNLVILAICHPEEVNYLRQNEISLYGNVLSIYDSVDEYAGSCQDLFAYSQGKGLARHDEVVLDIGMGHGFLYQPMDEWILPAVEWAGKP